jgi:ATP-binding cassette subfamily C protein
MAFRQAPPNQPDPIAEALRTCRGALVAAAVFSGVLNVLTLSGALYMLQVYDRVLTSRSQQTLVGLTLLLALCFVVQGILDVIRQRLLTRIGAAVDRRLAEDVFRLTATMPLRAGPGHDPLQPGRDLDAVRGFVSSLGPTTFFDMPWVPLFVVLCFIIHPWIGATVLVGCATLFAVTLLTERAARAPVGETARTAAARAGIAEATRRNAEAIEAMGMRTALAARFGTVNDRFLVANERATDVVNTYATISRLLRMALQSGILGLGAWLVLMDQATPGVMIAASILMGRALAPIESAIGHWKPFIAARQARRRLGHILAAMPPQPTPLALPAPRRMLTLEQVFAGAPGQPQPIIHGVSLSLLAGQALGVIGPSASGKSTLARVLTGVWHPLRGSVRLDGSELGQWSDEARGRFIGYLPQDIALFDGTVAENIARFRPDATSEQVVAAAVAAGADEMIRRLDAGYQTRIGEGGITLSGGQRQRVALARALFGDPFLVVLDEPNANLDAEGEAAVTHAIRHVRERQGIAIVIAHRPSAIAAVDLVGLMKDGRLQAFGPRDEVLKRVLVPQRRQPT